MIVELSDGTRVDCEDTPMGGGASGTTYFSKDKEYVVKIFKKPHPETRRISEEVLGTYNCCNDETYWQQLMSWPDGIVTGLTLDERTWTPCLGVRMPSAPQSMDKMEWIIYPKLYNLLPSSKKLWDKRVLIALRLAAALAHMHRCGVAHSDVSPQNIMADPLTGRVNVIDLDRPVVPGFLPPEVIGTPGYIAPEILAGKSGPSVTTDRHALAVILYQLLLFRHPLRGPKVYSTDSDEDEKLALGESAIFIDHPEDPSNRPTKAFWPLSLLGDTLRDLFLRAFVQGIRDPSSRPTASEWHSALVRLVDRIVGCGNPKCDERYFPATEGRPLVCPWCNTPFVVRRGVPVLRLFVGDRRGQFQVERDNWIAGYPERTLHAWHAETGVEPGPNVDPSPVARIVLDNGQWFLLNMGLPHARVIENGTLGKHVAIQGRVELKEGLALMLASLPKGRMMYVQWIS